MGGVPSLKKIVRAVLAILKTYWFVSFLKIHPLGRFQYAYMRKESFLEIPIEFTSFILRNFSLLGAAPLALLSSAQQNEKFPRIFLPCCWGVVLVRSSVILGDLLALYHISKNYYWPMFWIFTSQFPLISAKKLQFYISLNIVL